MTILQVPFQNAPLELLILADPSAERVAAYLDENSVIFVGEEAGAVLAAAVMRREGDTFELLNLAVAEERRRGGLGGRMLAHVLSFAEKCGAIRVTVGTGNSSLGPIGFYRKHGFKITGVRANFFRDYVPPIFENGVRCVDMVRLSYENIRRGPVALGKILVTGASGTVGSAVVDALSAAGIYEVHAVMRAAQAARERVIQKQGDLESPAFYRELSANDYDGIIHAAQLRSWRTENTAKEGFDLCVVRNLESLCTAKTRLIYTSGVWIYGHQERGQRIDENSPMRPIQHAAERMQTLSYLRNESPYRWVEVVLPSLVYGPVGPLVSIRDGLRSGGALAVDDRSVQWSLIERTDVGELYRLLLEADCSERLFLAAEPQSMAIVELYETVARRLGMPFAGITKTALKNRVSPEDFEVMTMSQPVDSSRLRKITGWFPRNTFLESYARLLGI